MAHKETKRRSISPARRREILQRDGYICGYCEKPKRRKPASLVIDHIIPVKDGGYHETENWVRRRKSQLPHKGNEHEAKENGKEPIEALGSPLL